MGQGMRGARRKPRSQHPHLRRRGGQAVRQAHTSREGTAIYDLLKPLEGGILEGSDDSAAERPMRSIATAAFS
ncbi:MAG: hypothetical protein ACLT98_07715 [Eggerthellaceae bacterium]